MRSRLVLSLFRLDNVLQALYDQDFIFLQLPYNLDALAILSQQSLPESERRGPYYSQAKCVRGLCEKCASSGSVHHVGIYVIYRSQGFILLTLTPSPGA